MLATRPAPLPPSHCELDSPTLASEYWAPPSSIDPFGTGPSSPPSTNTSQSRPRRGSFSFLSRTKSFEVPTTQTRTGRTMLRKHKVRDQEEFLRRQQRAVSQEPPQLPSPPPLPVLGTFGGENYRPDSIAIISGKGYLPTNNFSRPNLSPMSSIDSNPHVGPNGQSMASVQRQSSSPAYAIRSGHNKGEYSDQYPRSGSMTNRGRESYTSLALGHNSPRKVRRRKDPTPFK